MTLREKTPISVFRLWLLVVGVLALILAVCVYFLKYSGPPLQ